MVLAPRLVNRCTIGKRVLVAPPIDLSLQYVVQHVDICTLQIVHPISAENRIFTSYNGGLFDSTIASPLLLACGTAYIHQQKSSVNAAIHHML